MESKQAAYERWLLESSAKQNAKRDKRDIKKGNMVLGDITLAHLDAMEAKLKALKAARRSK